MTRRLPARPNLEHLKKQAKRLLRALEDPSPVTRERYRALFSRPVPEHPRLADAHHALAREYGFASWTMLRSHVESVAAEADPVAMLVTAIKTNDVSAARRALERHPRLRERLDDPLPGFDFGATPLIAALPTGNRELIDLLLDSGADIHQRSHWWAGGFGVLDGDHPLVRHLIERGARVDAHAAARHGMLDELVRLVETDPTCVAARGGDGQTPLHVAASVEIASLLLDHGADIDALDVDHESTPAQYLVRRRPEVTRFLVERGCRTDLLMLSALGDLERVRRHLDVDPESIHMSVSETSFPKRDPRAGGTIYIWTLGAHRTAHVIAREFEHEDVLALLIERSPAELRLALACELGDEEAFAALLRSRPDLTRTLTEDDRRKLVFAAESDNTRAVRMMLAAGWPPDVRGQRGGTPLHWACWHGNVEMMREILRHRSVTETRDDDYGQTPLGWAMHGSLHGWHRDRGDYVTTVEGLLDAGAKAPRSVDGLEASAEVLAVLRRRYDS
ncbi:MAG: ankyrin repeat domain-containing protein [Candidatus Eisenbacteria bacterium]